MDSDALDSSADERFQLQDSEIALTQSRFVSEISLLMESLGVSQAELARRLGVSGSRVAQILGGEGNLQLKTIGSIGWALGVRWWPQPVCAPVTSFDGLNHPEWVIEPHKVARIDTDIPDPAADSGRPLAICETMWPREVTHGWAGIDSAVTSAGCPAWGPPSSNVSMASETGTSGRALIDATELLEVVELQNIYRTMLEAQLPQAAPTEPTMFELHAQVRHVEIRPHRVTFSYQSLVSDRTADSNGLRVHCCHNAVFSYTGSHALSLEADHDALRWLGVTVGWLAVYPYLRQTVTQATIDAGLPTLTLPLARQASTDSA